MPSPAKRSPPGRLIPRTVAFADLDGSTCDAMRRLFAHSYADVELSTFEADLAGKEAVILLLDSSDETLPGLPTVVRDGSASSLTSPSSRTPALDTPRATSSAASAVSTRASRASTASAPPVAVCTAP